MASPVATNGTSGKLRTTLKRRAHMAGRAFLEEAYAKWCDDHNAVLWHKAPDQLPTHYTMDGQNLNIPPALVDAFEKMYAESIKAGASLFVIECRTPVFRMPFDLDVVQPVAATTQDAETMLRIICDTMAGFYPTSPDLDKLLQVLLLAAGAKRARDVTLADGTIVQRTKVGFH